MLREEGLCCLHLERNPWKARGLRSWNREEDMSFQTLKDSFSFTYPKARSALLKPSVYTPAHAKRVGVKAPEQTHENTQSPGQNQLASFFFSCNIGPCKDLCGENVNK